MGTKLQTIELSTPGKDIESYLSSVHSIPILTPVQERELAQKLYDNDDLDAARQLVLAHLRFVVLPPLLADAGTGSAPRLSLPSRHHHSDRRSAAGSRFCRDSAERARGRRHGPSIA